MAHFNPFFKMDHVVHDYRLKRHSLFKAPSKIRALDGISLTIHKGKSLGLIGGSGSGKSTLARLAVALEKPTSGHVTFEQNDILAASPEIFSRFRRHVQMVFQDPYGSLDPRQTVTKIITEPLWREIKQFNRTERRDIATDALATVGLGNNALDRYPHEFSGGQRQRIAFARALITEPELVIADEPVSALDVSVQAQILNLISELEEKRNVTFLFISHDLMVVRHVTHEIAVLYQGRVIESGKTAEVFSHPLHPYTQALIDAVPRPDPTRRRRPKTHTHKSLHKPLFPISKRGCAFAPYCPLAQKRCHDETPPLTSITDQRLTACHFPLL